LEITWYGHACFRLKDRGIAIVTDPYDSSLGYVLPRLQADVVTVSHQVPGHSNIAAVRSRPKVLSGPGEYEVKGVFITGFPTYHRAARRAPPERNTIFVFEFNSLTVCHLGDLGTILAQDQIEALPPLDVLLVPVGGRATLDAARAAEVIGLLEPKLVIPMHYKTPHYKGRLDKLDKFLKEMGLPPQEPRETLKITSSDLPDETHVVILDYKQGTA